MGSFDGKKKQDIFINVLQDKKIPVLTLDNKWYKLLNSIDREETKDLEDELNTLLKRQGRINTETKEIKKIKKRLMNDIVSMVDEVEGTGNKSLEKKIEDNKRLLAECNQKLEGYQDEMLEIPREIDRVNNQLMLVTMEQCYETMQENTDEIEDISKWVTQIRIDLKKRLIRKQEMEQKNHEIYSYMHDLFGADVVNIFDMRYNPEEHHPKPAKKQDDNPENKE